MNAPKFEFTGLTPCVRYEDAGAMLDWLARVFGFEERGRYVDQDGVVRQAEMYVGANELFLSGHGPGHWAKLGRRPEEWIVVWVEDVDAHHARVVAAGVEAPAPKDQDWGVRSFSLRDPEGYGWSFMRRLARGYIQTKPTHEGGLKEILAPAARR
jgi:uncharacterized glyoxalase superfamily protein PhnB